MLIRVPLVFAALMLVGSFACATKAPSEGPPREPAGRSARLVSATVLANECATVSKANAKLSEDAMYKLVEGCTTVPNGGVRFTATMLPGGRIEITQAPGQSESVPICVLKNELRHKVPLAQACKLEVRLEEGTIALPDAGASD